MSVLKVMQVTKPVKLVWMQRRTDSFNTTRHHPFRSAKIPTRASSIHASSMP
jgi:hypothetical protein